MPHPAQEFRRPTSASCKPAKQRWKHAGALLLAASTAMPATAAEVLYPELGASDGITLLVSDFVDRLRANPRIGKQFADVNPRHLKKQLANQLCRISGGPCVYDGEEMRVSHASLKISTAQFNTLVEELQDAMEQRLIPFSVQNELLARLAPMHRDIITSHADVQGGGKLLLTAGVSSVDGAAGGGLTPWATVGTYASDSAIGVSAHATRVSTNDYGLTAAGITVGWHDQLEFSLARQALDTGVTGVGLGLPGLQLQQDIVGAKVRLMGEAVLDSDRWMPQIAAGVEFKSLHSSGLDATLAALGASREGTDFYISATKLLLAQGILINGTLRATKANQNGLLGFGGTLGGAHDSNQLMPEISVAWLPNRNLAIGLEYRRMPNNLQDAGNAAGLGDGLRAQDWKDVFIAWAPSKNVSLTLALVDLGVIVPATTDARRQIGGYVSAQLAY